MKKASSLFLLSIFLFNTVGYYVVFKTVQYQLKSEMQYELKSGFGTDELETLIISKDNLVKIEWLEPGREMRYNNQLYDIVKSTETDFAITFYCINDTKEKSLLSQLDGHINTHVANHSTKNDSSEKLVDAVAKIYFSTACSFSFIQASSEAIFFIPNFSYTSAFITTNSPPPEFV